jgi:hypothetical protein
LISAKEGDIIILEGVDDKVGYKRDLSFGDFGAEDRYKTGCPALLAYLLLLDICLLHKIQADTL